MEEKNKNFKSLVIFAIVLIMGLAVIAVLPTVIADCPDDCPDGMVYYWKLDETSAGPVVDCYGSNDGTNYGATINQPGMIGTSYGFDGINGYIDAPSHCLGANSDWTASCWFIADSSSVSSYHYLMSTGSWGGIGTVQIWQDCTGGGHHGEIAVRLIDDNGDDVNLWGETGNNYLDDQWHLMHATWDASLHELSLYIDGALEKQGSKVACDAGSGTTNELCVGTRQDHGSGRFLKGGMDEIAIYDRVLSLSEIQSIYIKGLTNHGYCDCPDPVYVDDDYGTCASDCPSGMISYWKLDETSAGPVVDCYGSNDGTNNGATINQPGQVGTAYDFDGVDDYVDCGDISELNGASAFTIIGWIRQNNLNNNERVFDKIKDGDHDISVAPYNNRIYFEVGNGANSYGYWTGVPSTLFSGVWYHLAAVFDGSATGNANRAKSFTLSRPADDFGGDMDEVAIFDQVLSPSEISSHYYAGLAGHGYCRPPGWQYDHFDNIQDGVDAVCEGGTVYVADGTYYK